MSTERFVGSEKSMNEEKTVSLPANLESAVAPLAAFLRQMCESKVPISGTLKIIGTASKPIVEVKYEKPPAERDRRTMNHMSPETKLVHARLEAWGKYAKDRGIQGFPRQSLTEKAAQYGKLGIPQESNYRAEPQMPDHIAHVDAAIGRLWGVGQRCVKRYYMNWAPREAMAKDEGMGVRQFQEVLRRARELIGMWLDDVEGRDGR